MVDHAIMRSPIVEVWVPAAQKDYNPEIKDHTNILLSETHSNIRDQSDVKLVCKKICVSVSRWLKNLFCKNFVYFPLQ